MKELIALPGTNINYVYGLSAQKYYLATVHRAENTDKPEKLKIILSTFNKLNLPVLLPIHPRTRKLVENMGLEFPNILFIEPVGYLEMLVLTCNAKKVLTDSGGLQKEAYFLNTPCVTLRDQTEWVETLKHGWNLLTPIQEDVIFKNIIKAQPFVDFHTQEKHVFGNGKAGQKIAKLLENLL